MKEYLSNLYNKTNIFTILSKLIVIILPFYVFLTVFFTNIIGLKFFGFFIKELLIVLLFISLAYEYIKNKKIPKFDIIDYLVFFYIFYGIIITIINGLGLNSIIHGGRYDFMFLVVMLIYKNSGEYLKTSKTELLKLFAYSGACSLLFGFALKFRFKEEFLMEFGYVDYISSRVYNGGIPIYHGLENSGIRRFQGLFDGPNAMAFFLILLGGVFLTLQKKKNEYYVFLVMFVIFWLLLLTYSRSSILGVFGAFGLIILLNIKTLFINHKKTLIGIGVIGLIFLSTLGILFQDQLKNIVLRESSTTGHIDRMVMGVKRFTEKPFGAGLAESGPGYRYIYPEKQTKEDELKYIPESWFIQVLIEGGIIYFFTFISILTLVGIRLYKNSLTIFGIFIAVLIMNVFLHMFEITYLSILTFVFIGLFIKKDKI